MRKNTLIKLLAVLAMCFLIGAALVSCGEGETEDVAAKTIVGVEFVGNDLVITYDDGTKTTTAIPEAAVCQHANPIQIVTEAHKLENGALTKDEVLYVCNDCASAWVEYKEGETLIHVASGDKVVKAPTCVDDGYSADICLHCGVEYNVVVTEETTKTGHTLGAAYFAEGDACVGGKTAKDCADCDYIEYTDVAAAANEGFDGVHNVATWNTVTAPTATTGGVVEGVCTVASCGKTITKEIGALPDKADNNEYDFDEADSDMFVECGDAANYIYVHKATGLEYNVTKAGDDVVKHELNGKPMTSVDQVEAGKEFETAYYYDEVPGVVLFANHPLVCDEAVLAHFRCTAVHDGGKCDKDISVYVKARHTTVGATWVGVPGEAPTCTEAGKETTNCTACGTAQYREVSALGHTYTYVDETLYTDAKDGTVFNTADYANVTDSKKPYHRDFCDNGCGTVAYRVVADYAVDVTTDPATCQGDGEGKISWTKCDGTNGAAVVVLPQFAHKTLVNGEKVAIVEGKENIKIKIYNADHADYKDLVKELDNVAFSTTEAVLGYIHCECTCKDCDAHDVTVWVQKLGADAPAMVDFQ